MGLQRQLLFLLLSRMQPEAGETRKQGQMHVESLNWSQVKREARKSPGIFSFYTSSVEPQLLDSF